MQIIIFYISAQLKQYNQSLITINDSIIALRRLLTTVMTLGKLVSDSCITFQFADDQIRYELIRAIIKSKKNVVRLGMCGVHLLNTDRHRQCCSVYADGLSATDH
jgi:hypothetical protein